MKDCVLRGILSFFCVFNTFGCRENDHFFVNACFLCSILIVQKSILIVQKSVLIGYRLNMTLFLLFSVTVVLLRSANIAV